MNWFSSICEKSFSRKDNMQRYVTSKRRNLGLTPFQTVPIEIVKATALEQVSYFDENKRNLIVFNDQMIDAS